jgi:GNAT superfamily N-acetyltransferase
MNRAIVPATDALVAEIELWLDAEEAAFKTAEAVWSEAPFDGPEPVRGFRCNWDSVKKSWREGHSPLDVLLVDGKAVGFLFGTVIMEIHPDHRGRGLGVLLSDFMLKRVSDEGYSILEIEIAPSTAEPFWLRQGFALLDDDIHFRNGLHAYLAIPRTFPLGDGPRVAVEIAFYDEKTVSHGATPFASFEGDGERLPDGAVQLPERVHGYSPLLRNNVENHIRITVGGEEVYFGRSKYGKEHGPARDPGGNHYIDRILPA